VHPSILCPVQILENHWKQLKKSTSLRNETADLRQFTVQQQMDMQKNAVVDLHLVHVIPETIVSPTDIHIAVPEDATTLIIIGTEKDA
jgi:hypothetical protein